MLLIVSLVVVLLLLLWIGLIFLRKGLWDAAHRNLLDLEDRYGGQVIRNSFAARPVYKGKIHNREITINFSSEKGKKGRINYMDISINADSALTLTIAESGWLEDQNPENPLSETVVEAGGRRYHLMPDKNRKLERLAAKKEFINAVGRFDKLAYFFIGKSGVICEFKMDNAARDTEFEPLNARLQNIFILLSVIG